MKQFEVSPYLLLTFTHISYPFELSQKKFYLVAFFSKKVFVVPISLVSHCLQTCWRGIFIFN